MKKSNQLRKVEIIRNFTKTPAGSVLVKWGNTWVLCTASVSEKVPPFLKDTGRGWEIKTAEDILTALLIFPAFQTISSYYIWDAIDRATTDRKEYADIREFAEYLLTNYI